MKEPKIPYLMIRTQIQKINKLQEKEQINKNPKNYLSIIIFQLFFDFNISEN